jgi:uncharacterized protein (DUF58 family)
MSLQWFILLFFLLALLQTWIFKTWSLKAIEYERQFSQRTASVGQQIELVESFSNRKLLPIFWLRIESSLGTGLGFHEHADVSIKQGERIQHHRSLFSFKPFSKIVRRHQVQCLKRGYYVQDAVHITSGDPLGFSKDTVRVSTQAVVTVYPEIISMQEWVPYTRSWFGDWIVRRWIISDPFVRSGVRDYHTGDPLNQIHWKSTAKAGRLQVYKQDFTADPKLMILLNFETTERMWNKVTKPALVETGITYSASITHEMTTQGLEVGFFCNGSALGKPGVPVHIPPGQGLAHEQAILEALAKLQLEACLSIDVCLENFDQLESDASDLLLITAYVSDTMEQKLQKLRHLGYQIEVLMLEDSDRGEAVLHDSDQAVI